MKLPAKKVVRRYELTYLLPVSYTETELKGFRDAVEETLTKNKTHIESTEEWGKKRLAYAIKFNQSAQTEAHYVHVVFSAEPSAVKKIEAELLLNNTLIRYLLVAADEKAEKVAPAQSQEKEVEETEAK